MAEQKKNAQKWEEHMEKKAKGSKTDDSEIIRPAKKAPNAAGQGKTEAGAQVERVEAKAVAKPAVATQAEQEKTEAKAQAKQDKSQAKAAAPKPAQKASPQPPAKEATIEEKMRDMEILKHPLVTEKAVNMIESENKLTFVVDSKATKPTIRKAVESLYKVKVNSVNILRDMKARKRAIVTLSKEFKAGDIATKLGVV